jgi:polyisoprenoid-binding protein YceI
MTISKTLTLGLLGASLLFANAAQAEQKLLPAQSEIGFVSKQMGVPVEGRFKKFDAQIAFDPTKPEASKIAFTIDTGSATVGAPESDAELPKAAWFNVPKFPQATFQSSAVKGLGGGKFEVAGKLSIKGNVRDVVVPVTLTQNGATTTANGAFAIKRLVFKIGDGEWADTSMVADDVQVKFKLALSGVAKF